MEKNSRVKRAKLLKKNGTTPAYFRFFFILVILPGIILSLIALRTLNRETVYIEKQIRDNLVLELTGACTITENLLGALKNELDSLSAKGKSLFVNSPQDTPVAIIGVPFRLSQKRDIIEPVYRAGLSKSELEFFKYNQDFFQDRTPITVYKNVALAFSSEKEGKKAAISRYKQSKSVQKEIFDQLQSSNMKVAKRSLKSTSKEVEKGSQSVEEQSEYITESLRFSEIISNKTSGIIPRMIDEQMILLYWNKDENNEITGCVINDRLLKQRLIEALPGSHTDVRILTLVDHTGRPIIPVFPHDTTNWKRPFVSQEVSELLPGWEAAAYLSNPDTVKERGRLTALIVGCIITFLLLSLIIGSTIILRTMKAQTILAQQKTTFVANVSHELKTPLTSIRLFAELLKENRQADPVKQKKYLSIMVSETERLTRLINNVLDFSRSKKGEKKYRWETLDLVNLVSELVESQCDRFEHNGFTVTVDSGTAKLPVKADNEAMKQVLINLLSNAEKYSPDMKNIFIRTFQESEKAVVEIEDRGIGISRDDMKYIFEEFYRVDDSLTANVNGTGLGLSISKRIIDDHGGTISCYSAKPRGTVFRITLPIVTVCDNLR